jgi:hypothetical protein
MNAVRFLLLMEKGYQRYDEPDLKVEMDFGDCVVSREAEYALDGKKTKDIITLDGIKREHMHGQMPDEVKKKTRVFNLDVEDLKKKVCLNFIGQRDPILPKALMPSQISKLFGSVSGRNRIDSAIKKTNVVIRALRMEKNRDEKAAESLNVAISEVEAGIPPHSPDMSALVEAMRVQFEVREIAASLFAANKALDADNKTLSRIDATLAKVDMTPIDAHMASMVEKVRLAGELRPIVDIDLTAIDAALAGFAEIDDKMVDMSDMVDDVKAIVSLNLDLENYEGDLKGLDFKILGLTHRIESVLDTGHCPYSGKKLPKACRGALIEE